jgi:hypothetical protein
LSPGIVNVDSSQKARKNDQAAINKKKETNKHDMHWSKKESLLLKAVYVHVNAKHISELAVIH